MTSFSQNPSPSPFPFPPAFPELRLDIGNYPVRAIVFALPVVAWNDPGGGLPPYLGDIADIGQLLHGPGGMGGKSQGLYMLSQLMSSAMVANLSSPRRQSLLAALMIDDCDKVALGEEPCLDSHIDLDSDETAALPLRFLIGCVYRHEHDVPVHLASKQQWEQEGLGTKVEGAMGLCLGGTSDGLVHRARRPTVLAPLPLADALVQGLLEVIRQSLRACPRGAVPELHLLGNDEVELRLVGVEQILSIRLSTALLDTRRIEQLLDGAHALFGGRSRQSWQGAAAAH
jgi:hypothetical protein